MLLVLQMTVFDAMTLSSVVVCSLQRIAVRWYALAMCPGLMAGH